MYRLESLFCFIVSLKLYLFWRVVRDLILMRHIKRRIISRFTFIDFDSKFAFKVLLNSHGLLLTMWDVEVIRGERF